MMKPSRIRDKIQLLFRIGFAVFIALLFLGYDTFFTVSEGSAVVVTRLGQPVREILTAGPYWKLPAPVDQLHVIDLRRRVFVTPDAATFTRDKKNVVLTTYVIWHIERPLTFLQAVADGVTAETSLAGMITAAKTRRIGNRDLTALVSNRSDDVRVAEIEEEIGTDVSQAAFDRMGIVVDQVGIERIAFPDENLSAVFDRMRIERQSEANRLRAEGAKAAQSIRDDAHVQSQEILRIGREEASRIAASAERQAAERLASEHERNPEFYRFWSSLQASKRVLKERATLILSSEELFFDGLMPSRGKIVPRENEIQARRRQSRGSAAPEGLEP